MKQHGTFALPRAKWERARRAALERSGWRCERCGYPGSGNDRLEVHHVIPLHLNGDEYALSNLLVWHRSEHIEHHREEKKKPESEAVKAWRRLVDDPTL